jgi:hypothetical protein
VRLFALVIPALFLFATAADAQYVGVTAEAFDGAQGVFTYNLACHTAHSGSRMCTSEEVIETVNPPILGILGERAWVRPTFQPLATGSTTRWSVDASGLANTSGSFTCDGWENESARGLTIDLGVGAFRTIDCDTALKVACCIPVPEPSAALTIPSGAAMVLALAKLRGTSPIR